MVKQHDISLDIYRSLTMIYILCVIHVLYWLGGASEIVGSLVLFEMPIIFFISGASLRLSMKGDYMSQRISVGNLLRQTYNRFQRVCIPYYIYALVLVVLTFASSLVIGGEWLTFSLRDIWKILSFQDIPHVPFVWHVWFILPYMILTSTFLLQTILLRRLGALRYFLLNIILFLFVSQASISSLLCTILGYNLFLLAGFLLYRRISLKKVGLIWLGVTTVLCLLILTNTFSFTPMQIHKFPPDVIFVCYGASVICVLSFLFYKFNPKRITPLINIWNKHGYTIYLYQNIIFLIVCMIEFKMTLRNLPDHTLFIIRSLLVFILSTLSAPLLAFFEVKIRDLFSVIIKKTQ